MTRRMRQRNRVIVALDAQTQTEDEKKAPKGLAALLRRFAEIVAGSRDHLLAGAVARTVSILAMFPVDTLKTRLQASQSSAQNVMQDLLKGSNPYRGMLPSLIGQTPYGMLVFGSYQAYKETVSELLPNVSERVKVLLAACLGDLTGSLWLCPSEVIKQQQQSGLFANLGEAVRSTLRASGVGGLYRGYGGLIVRDVPFRMSQLFFYEEFQRMFARRKSRQASPSENLVLGALAGCIGAAITTPLDVIKTRLMTQSSAVGTVVYKGAVDCVVKTVQTEGVRAMFRGILPRVLLIAPSNAIFFWVYETTISLLKKQKPASKTVAFAPCVCRRHNPSTRMRAC